MNIPSDAWQVIGAIIIGMVAGLVSFIVTILAKEQKTSEFRQSWIDALREDLSEFAATCITLTDALRVLANKGADHKTIRDQLLDVRYEEVKKIETLRARILLRLNPVEHTKIIKLINAAYSYSALRDEGKDGKGGEGLVADFIAESQVVLKREWRRVKTGELTFRITKALSLITFVISVGCAVAYWQGHFVIKYVAPATS